MQPPSYLNNMNMKDIVKVLSLLTEETSLIDTILYEDIRFRRVKSSNLHSVGYDSKTRTLEIKFKGGGHYRYDDVSIIMFKRLLRAASKGKFFHKHIRWEYNYERLNF